MIYSCGEIVKVTNENNENPVCLRLKDSALDMTIGEPIKIRLSGYLVRGDVDKYSIMYSTPALAYKKVVFNLPATIVLWKDGTKTVVTCDKRDQFDATTGLALCFMKKALGNKSRALNDILDKEVMDG